MAVVDVTDEHVKRGAARIASQFHKDLMEQAEVYLEHVSETHSAIRVDSQYVGGKPSLSTRRIPVALVLACLRDDMSKQQICEDYDITEEQINKAIDYAISVLDTPYHCD